MILLLTPKTMNDFSSYEWLEIELPEDPIKSGKFDIDNESLEVDE